MTRQLARADPLTNEALAAGCRQAAGQIDRALGQPPAGIVAAVDPVERAVALLRDGLIAHRRADSLTPALGAALGDLNVVLSLIVGVEYPQAALQRGYLEQARELLRAIADRAAPLRDASVTHDVP